MDSNVKRGDIFYADLSPVVGSEQEMCIRDRCPPGRDALWFLPMSGEFVMPVTEGHIDLP